MIKQAQVTSPAVAAGGGGAQDATHPELMVCFFFILFILNSTNNYLQMDYSGLSRQLPLLL